MLTPHMKVPMFFRTLSRRDALLLLLGAAAANIFTAFVSSHFYHPAPGASSTSNVYISTHPVQHGGDSPLDHGLNIDHDRDAHAAPVAPLAPYPVADPVVAPVEQPKTQQAPEPEPKLESIDIASVSDLPPTHVLAHAPGWTIFKDIYMSNGTFFLVAPSPTAPADDSPEVRAWKSWAGAAYPEIRMMTSPGLWGYNEPGNIAAREPTDVHMAVISAEEAKRRWGKVGEESRNRVWTVEGSTLLFNDPEQHLQHYYHFAAELLFGAQAFWHGTFSPSPSASPKVPSPTPDRAIFAHAAPTGWRDRPGFNPYVLRAAFPALAVETVDDWEDRIAGTVPPDPDAPPPVYADIHAPAPDGVVPPPLSDDELQIAGARGPGLWLEANSQARAWHFPRLLLADRSAAHRGPICGSRTQRTASEAVLEMRGRGRLDGRMWWEPVRRRVLAFAGVSEAARESGMTDEPERADAPIVVTYISRQGSRRRLRDEDHDALVAELEALVAAKNAVQGGRRWELVVMQAERMTKDEQVTAAGRTTVLVGVHGNGLTHMIMMPPSRFSLVLELFFPGGVAHDYEWTSSVGLGMQYYAVWNDTATPSPETAERYPAYPDGFHGTEIPVQGELVARLIDEHITRVESGTAPS